MSEEIKPGKYQHFKGKFYEVLGVAKHTETNEELVFYQALYYSKEFGDKALWARPKKMFLEDKVLEGGTKIPRFKFVGDN